MVVHHQRAEGLDADVPSYHYFPERLQKFIPANTMPEASAMVTNVPACNNAHKLRPADLSGGKSKRRPSPVRKQENSFYELVGALSVYLKPGQSVMDCCCGAAVSGLGAIRLGAGAIYMNDRDAEVVALAKARALRYYAGCKKSGILDAEGNPIDMVGAEAELGHVYGVQAYMDALEEKKPADNFPSDFSHTDRGLVEMCRRHSVVKEKSTLKLAEGQPSEGLFAVKRFEDK